MISRTLQFLLLFFVVNSITRSVSAAEMVVGNIRVIKVQGKSAEMIDPSGRKSAVQEGAFIRQGTKIFTGPDSRVDLVFENGSSVNISPSSQFSIDEFVQDPFDSETLDYRAVEQAPTTSVTKIGVPDGDIIFNVAKQKAGSSFEISTPVGSAGIRGTSGFAGRRGFGLATGSASFRSNSGTNVNVVAGTQVSPNGIAGPASPAAINSVNSATAEMRAATPPNTFLGSPPNLLPQQQNALDSSASRGGDALQDTASELSAASPGDAPAIAAVASLIIPDDASAIAGSVAQRVPDSAPLIAAAVAQAIPSIAPQVAAFVAQVVPASAPQIAASVAMVVPASAPVIASSVSEVVPAEAPRIAASVSQAVPNSAPQIAASVVQVVPAFAAEVAASVARIVPDNASAIARSVSQVVPQQSENIANSVINAVPAVDAAAVQQAANQGASQPIQRGGGDAVQSSVNEKPQPANNAANPPPPPPQLTPQSTPTNTTSLPESVPQNTPPITSVPLSPTTQPTINPPSVAPSPSPSPSPSPTITTILTGFNLHERKVSGNGVHTVKIVAPTSNSPAPITYRSNPSGGAGINGSIITLNSSPVRIYAEQIAIGNFSAASVSILLMWNDDPPLDAVISHP